MKVARRIALAGLVSVGLLTCDSGPSDGELVARLTTSRDDARAIRFTVTAAESKMVEAVTPACSGCLVFTARVSDREVRGVVTGALQAGPVFRVLVSDVGTPSAYGAQVVEVADAGFALLSPGEYRLEFRKP